MTETAPKISTVSSRPTMDESIFRKFVEFIYDTTGIKFDDNKNYFLTSKVNHRCDVLGLKNDIAYYDYITTNVDRRTELPKFIDIITIHETFFFRNEPQLKAFERDVLAPLVAAKKLSADKKIRIWSAACSTGDEVYTTVLQFLKNNWLADINLEIVGTDISQQAVEDSKKAIYAQYGVRNIPSDMLKKYFKDIDGKRFELDESVKKFTKFSVANLKEQSDIRRLGKFDIIICRNVLIYFDANSKEQVLWNIYDTMSENSLLLVGHSENLYSYKHIFRSDRELASAFAYRKAPPGTEKLHV